MDHNRVIGVVLSAGLYIPAVLLGFVACISTCTRLSNFPAALAALTLVLYFKSFFIGIIVLPLCYVVIIMIPLLLENLDSLMLL